MNYRYEIRYVAMKFDLCEIAILPNLTWHNPAPGFGGALPHVVDNSDGQCVGC